MNIEALTVEGKRELAGMVCEEYLMLSLMRSLPTLILKAAQRKGRKKKKTALQIQMEFLEKTAPHEEAFIELMVAAFRAMEREVVRNMKGTPKSFVKAGFDVDAWLFSREKWRGDISAMTHKMGSAVLPEFADDTLHGIGVGTTFNQVDKRALTWLATNAHNAGWSITDTAFEKVRSELLEGVAAGLSIPHIVERLRGVFDDMTKEKATQIARTEVLKASNRGCLEGMIQSGVVEGKIWLATVDKRTCSHCEEMDGHTAPLEKSFFDKGDEHTWADGTKELFDYDEIPAPPLHVLCRCTIEAILKQMYVDAWAKKRPERGHLGAMIIDDAVRQIREDYAAYYKKPLSEAEANEMYQAARSFTRGGDISMRRAQLGQVQEFVSRADYERWLAKANTFERLLDFAPSFERDHAIYRGLKVTSWNEASKSMVEGIKKMSIGDTMEMKTTAHWTTDGKVAEGFGNDVMLIVQKGGVTRSTSVSHISAFGTEESEVAVSKNSVLRLVHKEMRQIRPVGMDKTLCYIFEEVI